MFDPLARSFHLVSIVAAKSATGLPTFILFMVVLFGLAIAAAVWGRKLKAKQTQTLQKAADELGFRFTPGPFTRNDLPVPIPELELFALGTDHRFSNLLQGMDGATPILIFDFQYRHGAHQGGTLRVVAFENVKPALPTFSLRPELHLGPFVNTPPVVGKVEFPEQPDFNARIGVARIEPAQAHTFFNEPLRTFFLKRWGTAAENQEGRLFVSRIDQPNVANDRADAVALRRILGQAREVREALEARIA